jgi:tetratricopeptide (TPR) repeat protein
MNWCDQLEKLDIEFSDEFGNPIKLSAFPDYTGSVSYKIIGRETIDEQATAMHNKARLLGSEGKYDQAIEYFQKAAGLDPNWPYPLYDLAFTYLLKGDQERAIEYYQKVEKLAPEGFFTTNVAIDTITREQQGTLYPGAYLEIVSIENVREPSEKVRILKDMLTKSEEFPAAWEKLSWLLKDPSARMAAIENGLSYNPDLLTKGKLLINKATILRDQGDEDGSDEILVSIAMDEHSTLDVKAMATLSLCIHQLHE